VKYLVLWLASLAVVASARSLDHALRPLAPDTTLVRYGDTLRVRRGLDTVSLKIAVPATFPAGKYWWHFHGPNMITKLPYRGVVIVVSP
jgi:hypothetical protein